MERDPKKYPFGCKCQTLHHRVTGDGCDECNPDVPFSEQLRSRHATINAGHTPRSKGYVTWLFIAKRIICHPLSTLNCWLADSTPPHPAIQAKALADLDNYIKKQQKKPKGTRK